MKREPDSKKTQYHYRDHEPKAKFAAGRSSTSFIRVLGYWISKRRRNIAQFIFATETADFLKHEPTNIHLLPAFVPARGVLCGPVVRTVRCVPRRVYHRFHDQLTFYFGRTIHLPRHKIPLSESYPHKTVTSSMFTCCLQCVT